MEELKKIDFDELIEKIQRNRGPEGLDLSFRDFSNLDLGSKFISAFLQESEITNEHLPNWAIVVTKTQPSGKAFWRIDLKDKDNHHPISISKNLKYSLNLKGAILKGSNFGNTNLERINFENADLVDSNFEKSNLWGAVLDNANLWHANLKDTYFATASLENSILSYANLENSNLSYCNLINCQLDNANLANVTAFGANFTNANLLRSNIGKTSFWNANIKDARISREIIFNGILQENKEAFWGHLGCGSILM